MIKSLKQPRESLGFVTAYLHVVYTARPLWTHMCSDSFHIIVIIIVIVVVQVCGYRLRLHFDGYSDCHDFWVNANSADIHPPGWCESTGHKLQTPKGQSCQCSRHYLPTLTEQNKINSRKRTENMNFPSPVEVNP